MNLYRIVVHTVSEYFIKAETEDIAALFAETGQGASECLVVSESQITWSDSDRLTREE